MQADHRPSRCHSVPTRDSGGVNPHAESGGKHHAHSRGRGSGRKTPESPRRVPEDYQAADKSGLSVQKLTETGGSEMRVHPERHHRGVSLEALVMTEAQPKTEQRHVHEHEDKSGSRRSQSSAHRRRRRDQFMDILRGNKRGSRGRADEPHPEAQSTPSLAACNPDGHQEVETKLPLIDVHPGAITVTVYDSGDGEIKG